MNSLKNTQIRQILQTTIWFVVMLVVLYFALSYVANSVRFSGKRLMVHINPYMPLHGGQEALMTKDFDSTQGLDVFVVGSSHAYRGYDPRVFNSVGLKLFNAGSSSQSPEVSQILLLELARKSDARPLIVFDVYDKILELDGNESIGRMLMNSEQQSIAHKLLFNDFGVRNMNIYFARLFANTTSYEAQAKDYVENGYCSNTHVLSAFSEKELTHFAGNAETIAHLKTCLEWLKNNGFRFVLVSHPMPMQKGYGLYHAPAAAIIYDLAQQFDSEFLDYSQVDNFTNDSTLFADETHLNQNGVNQFNQLLIKDLRLKGFLSGLDGPP